jgi:hypothetical protein
MNSRRRIRDLLGSISEYYRSGGCKGTIVRAATATRQEA